jgi:hypothetical protein
LKTYTFHKMLGGKAVLVILGIIFFLMYGCGQKEEPVKPLQSSGPPDSSEQKEFIQFPGLGDLEVTAPVFDGRLAKLVIRDSEKKILFQFGMGYSSENNLYIRHIQFNAQHIPGLPDPLLMVRAAGGAGAGAWEIALIGVVSGKLKLLWKKTSDPGGGLFVGDLGPKRGIGIAQWLWISSEQEGCPACPPDTYFFKLYLWNKEKAQFDIGPKFSINEKRFDDIKKLGLDFPNQQEDFFR